MFCQTLIWPKPGKSLTKIVPKMSQKYPKNDQFLIRIWSKNNQNFGYFWASTQVKPQNLSHFWVLLSGLTKLGPKLVTWGGRCEILKRSLTCQAPILIPKIGQIFNFWKPCRFSKSTSSKNLKLRSDDSNLEWTLYPQVPEIDFVLYTGSGPTRGSKCARVGHIWWQAACRHKDRRMHA